MQKTSLKRLVSVGGGQVVAARLQRPSKNTNMRWAVFVPGTRFTATGDTPEEACDNLRDTLKRSV